MSTPKFRNKFKSPKPSINSDKRNYGIFKEKSSELKTIETSITVSEFVYKIIHEVLGY